MMTVSCADAEKTGAMLLMPTITLSWYFCLSIFTSLAVEVNFNKDSYTVAESNGQVSVSLRINGQYFVPVWAIVKISDGTATGGLCKACISGKRCVLYVAYIRIWLIFVCVRYMSFTPYIYND